MRQSLVGSVMIKGREGGGRVRPSAGRVLTVQFDKFCVSLALDCVECFFDEQLASAIIPYGLVRYNRTSSINAIWKSKCVSVVSLPFNAIRETNQISLSNAYMCLRIIMGSNNGLSSRVDCWSGISHGNVDSTSVCLLLISVVWTKVFTLTLQNTQLRF